MSAITTPQILISSSEVVLDRGAKETPNLKPLVKDETVAAKVLRVVSNRRALLMINGQKVYAKTFLPLQAGQNLLLQVEQTGAQPVLKFVGLPEEAPGSNPRIPVGSFAKARPYVILSQLLAGLKPSLETGGRELSERLAALDRLASSMSLKSEIPVDGFLQRLMSGSGLQWESKLAKALLHGSIPSPADLDALVAGDLKALTLRLLSGGDTLSEALSEQLKGVLSGIEQHQLLNQHLIDSAGKCLLPIPVMWPSALKFGRLLLDLGNKKAGGGRENQVVAVSFFLSLSRLGELCGDFSIYKKEITGVFGVADEETRALFSSCLPELRQRLQAHGFRVHDIACRLLAPEQLSDTGLVNRAVESSPDGMLNLVV